MTAMEIAITVTLLLFGLLLWWSIRNSFGGAYQRHVPHPSHAAFHLYCIVAISGWGFHLLSNKAHAGILVVLVIYWLYNLRNFVITLRGWLRNEVVET